MRIALKRQRIYLDTCCLSRPFDAQIQARVRRETEALTQIIAAVEAGHLQWIASAVLVDEVNQNPNVIQRAQTKARLNLAHQIVSVGESEIQRGVQLELLGFKRKDAQHLACAESGGADIFLTTDAQVLKIAKRYHAQLRVRVENPETWLQEVTGNGTVRNDTA